MRWLPLLLVACTPDAVEPDTPSEPTFQFAFAVLADPHVTQTPERADRLVAALDWVDENAEARDIELVLVAGDIAWRGGQQAALDAFLGASLPVVPIVGDNEIQVGEEHEYHDAFKAYYTGLEAELVDFSRPVMPVYNPEQEQDSWFQSFSFTHGGVTFVGCDWSPRLIDPIWGEMAFLHDFDGGTFRFLEDTLADVPDGPAESVVLLSHQPMYLGPAGFVLDDWDVLASTLSAHGDQVAMNVAGHLHVNGESTLEDVGIDVFLTDATWDDVVTVRLFEVWGNEATYTYTTELVEVPFP